MYGGMSLAHARRHAFPTLFLSGLRRSFSFRGRVRVVVVLGRHRAGRHREWLRRGGEAAVIGEESNGKSVDVALGRSFTIALAENASTGYRWQLQSADKGLGTPKESTIPGDTSTPGAPGTHKFTWSAESAGNFSVTLVLQRAWAETTPPEKTFTVTIDVLDVKSAKSCGGLVGATCGVTEYCLYDAKASCGAGDQQAKCQPKPDLCPAIVMPVCGCDGKMYNNSCEAERGGVSVAGASCAQ